MIRSSSVGARVAERGLEEEAVELRLGERERALVLDRVLGREQQERLGQEARDAVDRHLPLGHRLEQRGLRLRHRAVDLVDEHDVGEDRARPELEVARALVEDGEARDVGRLQVRRALDPRRRRALDRWPRSRARAPSWPFRARPRRARGRRRRARARTSLISVALAVDDGLDVRQEPARRSRPRARAARYAGRTDSTSLMPADSSSSGLSRVKTPAYRRRLGDSFGSWNHGSPPASWVRV